MGLGLDYVKLGGLSGAERMTKYNRLISIEEELAQQGILGRFFFFFFVILSVSFLGWTEKGGQTKPKREREVVVSGFENTHLSLLNVKGNSV